MLDLEVIGLIGTGFQGIMLSVLLFVDRRMKFVSMKVLSTLILIFSLNLFGWGLMWTRTTDFFRLDFFTYNAILIYGPLFLLYLKLRYGQKVRKMYYIQFLPYILMTSILVPFLFMDSESVTQGLVYYKTLHILKIFDYSGILSSLIYVSLIWFEVYNITKHIDLDRRNKIWLRSISLFITFFVFAHNTYIIIYNITGLPVEHKYIIAGCMSFFIYSIGYLAYFKPELIGKYHLKKYGKTSLGKTDSLEKVNQLMQLIEEEQVFLDKDISLSRTAEKLGVSSHLLSQIVNERLSLSFTELMNTKRVERAKQLLQDPEYYNEKLISIAYSSGFNSKSSFYIAFKKATGQSPSEYRDSIEALSVLSH